MAIKASAEALKAARKARAKAFREAQKGKPKVTMRGKKALEESGINPETYRMDHQAPVGTEGNAAMSDLSDVYPSDLYGPQALQYYGTGDTVSDMQSLEAMRLAAGNPNATIPVYRAVPQGSPDEINYGDWVSPSRSYAEQHGNYFEGGAKILEGEAKAKDLYTDANSLNEWGYGAPAVAGGVIGAGLLGSEEAEAGTAKNLMTTAERLQRVKDMGFDADNVYYHGTDQKFSEFRGDKVSWVSERPSLAADYAIYRGNISGNDPTIRQLRIKKGNVFDLDTIDREGSVGSLFVALTKGRDIPDKVKAQLKENMKIIEKGALEEESGPSYQRHDFVQNAGELFGKKGAKALADSFDLMGIDTFKLTEQGVPTYGLRSNVNLRDIDAAFDPAKKDSPNLLAGGAGAALAGGLAMTPTEQAMASVSNSPIFGGFQADPVTSDIAATLGSSMVAQPLAFGNAALGAVQGETPEQIAARADKVRQALAVMPQSMQGQDAMLGVADQMDALDKKYGIGQKYNLVMDSLANQFPVPSWRPQVRALLGEF